MSYWKVSRWENESNIRITLSPLTTVSGKIKIDIYIYLQRKHKSFAGYVGITFRDRSPTSPRSLEPIEQVDPLDVVGEGGVGHQGLVAVDVIHRKLERQLVHTHQLTFTGLEYTTCHTRQKNNNNKLMEDVQSDTGTAAVAVLTHPNLMDLAGAKKQRRP